MIRKVIATFLAAMTLTAPALAAPEYGEHATVATVDYDEMYWGCGIQYARVIELQHSGEHNGTLIATYECATSGLRVAKPGYNIHVSHDGGSTWEMVTTVREKAASIQSEFNPHLYELPCQVGDMPEGTLLLAALSIDAAHKKNTAIRLYRSYDIGQTWEQYGSVTVAGGGDKSVWEPFLMVLPDGRLACYYSDCTQRESHSQKIVMKISEDGVNWGEVIDIVALEDRVLRPGMATIAQMNDGRYIMTYSVMQTLSNKDVFQVFPCVMEGAATRLVLKAPKTESSVRRIWLPKTLAYILRKWQEAQQEVKDFLGDEYQDFDLVVAHKNGRPVDNRIIEKEFERLKRAAELPNVVFHSLRHSSTTYKLKLNHGDIKATQGDTGHSEIEMITKVYAHILDEDRKLNAQKFDSEFYSNPDLRKVSVPSAQPVSAEQLLAQLKESPDLLNSLAKLLAGSITS